MQFTIDELKKFSSITTINKLNVASKKDKKLLTIYKMLAEKIKTRKTADYVNQKVQSLVENKIFKIVSTKFTMSKNYVDTFELTAVEVKKLQSSKLTYKDFKNLFVFVSKFVLCNYSVQQNLAKHERFYSQCLAQVNLVLNKFTADVIHSRSKKIKINDITLLNVTKKYDEFNKMLFDKTAKAKVAKLVKAKSKKQKVKVQNKITKALHRVLVK